MPHRIAVPSSEFIRNVGRWQSEALKQPIYITHHGRNRLVLAALEEFHASPSTHAAAEVSEFAALRAAYEGLLENVGEAHIAVDAGLTITTVNTAMSTLVGAPRSDLVGLTIDSVLPDVFGRALAERLARTVISGQSDMFENAFTGGRRFQVRIYPVGDGAVALLRNVTELRALTADLEEGRALRAALDVLVDFATIRLDMLGRIESAGPTFITWTGFDSEAIIGHRLVDLIAPTDRPKVLSLINEVCSSPAGRLPVTFLGRRGQPIACEISAAAIMSDFVPRGFVITIRRRSKD